MRVAVALGALVSVWCLGKHGRQDTVGGFGVEAAPVGWKFMDGMPVGRRTIVTDYVGCARTVQVTPVDGARLKVSIVIVYGTFGYTEGYSKSTPVKSSGIECRS